MPVLHQTPGHPQPLAALTGKYKNRFGAIQTAAAGLRVLILFLAFNHAESRSCSSALVCGDDGEPEILVRPAHGRGVRQIGERGRPGEIGFCLFR